MSHNIDEEMMVGGGIVSPDLNNGKQVTSHQEKIAPVRTTADSETIYIGDTVVSKKDLVEAFRGVLKPEVGLNNYPSPQRQFANPGPIGLSGFALTTFVLSLVNMHARHVTTPNVVVGLAFFYGGVVQLFAGLWEVACGNTFGATAFCSYGGFWLSYAAIQTDAFGIVAAYEGDEEMLASGLGFFLMGWFIFTTILAICAVRTTIMFFSLFSLLSLTFLLLACGEFTGHVGVTKAGGWVGIIVAFIAWYLAYKGMASKDNTFWLPYDRRMPFSPKRD